MPLIRALRGVCVGVASAIFCKRWAPGLYWFGNLRVCKFYFEKIRVFKAGFCYEYISME